MTCDEAKVLLHALLDGELDAGHAREVEAHVAGCPRCAAELAQFREMRAGDGRREPALRRAGGVAPRIEAALPAPPVRAPAPSRRSLLQGLCARHGAVGGRRRRRRVRGGAFGPGSAHSRRRGVGASALVAGRASDRRAVERSAHGEAVVQRQARGRAAGRSISRRRASPCSAAGSTTSTASRWRRSSIARRVHVINLFVAAGRERRSRRRAQRDGAGLQHRGAGAIRACASSRSAISAPTSCRSSTASSKRRCAPAREFQVGVVNRVVPSRSMRGSRSTSQDRYSFIASLVSPVRS